MKPKRRLAVLLVLLLVLGMSGSVTAVLLLGAAIVLAVWLIKRKQSENTTSPDL